MMMSATLHEPADVAKEIHGEGKVDRYFGRAEKGLTQRVAAGARCYVTRLALTPPSPFSVHRLKGVGGSWEQFSRHLCSGRSKIQYCPSACLSVLYGA